VRDVLPTQRYLAELAHLESEHGDLTAAVIAVEWALMNDASIGTPTGQAGVFALATAEVSSSPMPLVFYYSFDEQRVYLETVIRTS